MRRKEPVPKILTSVFLNRKYTVEYMSAAASVEKKECEASFISFLKPASYTLDIFDVFHKEIVKYLKILGLKGVSIRVLAFSTMRTGPRMKIVNKYLEILKSANVEIRWLSQDVAVEAVAMAMYRFVLVNADPFCRATETEVAGVIGEDTVYGQTITANMKGLSMVSGKRVVSPWGKRFLTLWDAQGISM